MDVFSETLIGPYSSSLRWIPTHPIQKRKDPPWWAKQILKHILNWLCWLEHQASVLLRVLSFVARPLSLTLCVLTTLESRPRAQGSQKRQSSRKRQSSQNVGPRVQHMTPVSANQCRASPPSAFGPVLPVGQSETSSGSLGAPPWRMVHGQHILRLCGMVPAPELNAKSMGEQHVQKRHIAVPGLHPSLLAL